MSSFTRGSGRSSGKLKTQLSEKHNESLPQPKVPKGTKLSLINSQPLISSGISSLDQILGGGISVGSIVLLEEDMYTSHWKTIVSYFISQGAQLSHSVSVITSDPLSTSETILSQLPSPVLDSSSSQTPPTSDSESFKIAWRYQNQKTVTSTSLPNTSSVTAQEFCHDFDLSDPVPSSQLKNFNIQLFDCLSASIVTDTNITERSHFLKNLYENCAQKLRFNPEQPQITRLSIISFLSPMWPYLTTKEIIQFFHALKGLVRSSLGVCLITIPSYIFQNNNNNNNQSTNHQDVHSLIQTIRHLSDIVLKIQSFESLGDKSEAISQQFSDYKGFFHILKLSSVNSLHSNQHLDTLNYGIVRKRKKLSIDKLHLPPEISRSSSQHSLSGSTSSSSTSSTSTSSTTSSSGNRSFQPIAKCGPGGSIVSSNDSQNLDF